MLQINKVIGRDKYLVVNKDGEKSIIEPETLEREHNIYGYNQEKARINEVFNKNKFYFEKIESYIELEVVPEIRKRKLENVVIPIIRALPLEHDSHNWRIHHGIYDKRSGFMYTSDFSLHTCIFEKFNYVKKLDIDFEYLKHLD